MTEKDYTTAFVVGQSPSEAFDAIVNVREWWSEKIEGTTDRAAQPSSIAFRICTAAKCAWTS